MTVARGPIDLSTTIAYSWSMDLTRPGDDVPITRLTQSLWSGMAGIKPKMPMPMIFL